MDTHQTLLKSVNNGNGYPAHFMEKCRKRKWIPGRLYGSVENWTGYPACPTATQRHKVKSVPSNQGLSVAPQLSYTEAPYFYTFSAMLLLTNIPLQDIYCN